LAAVAVQPLLLCLAALLFNLISLDVTITPEPLTSISAFMVNVVILLIATLGEEIGWRGVALPGLQQESSPVKASAVLGLLWGVWHIPFWLLLDSFDRFGFGYLFLNLLFVFPLTFYITWFSNHGKQSILLAVMFHLTFNIVNTVVLPVTIHIGAFVIFGVFEWITAFLVLPRLQTDAKRIAIVSPA
jgi:membrane protease YdiL (CAAX protease family)